MGKRTHTLLLVGINVMVFAVMAITQESILFDRPEDSAAMLRNGALFNPYVMKGEYWRLVTCMFMHWGIIHLVVNMYALYTLAKLIEEAFGGVYVWMLYLLTGIGAGIASLHFNLYVVSAGASGAIFGLYGYVIVRQVLVNFRDRQVLTNVLINFGIFVAINYFISKGMAVDTAAHIGGFVVGACISGLHFFRLFTSHAALTVMTLASPLLLFTVPGVQLDYFRVFQDVVRTERRIESASREAMNDREMVDSLRAWAGVWDTLQLRLSSLNRLPEGLHCDTTVVHQYIGLRKSIATYQLRMIERESYTYLDSIEIARGQMDTIPPLRYYLFQGMEDTQPQESDTSAQESALEVVTAYYDSAWRETTFLTEARYYRIGQRDSLGRWQGNVTDYYSSGKVQMKGAYKNDQHHGIFRYYSERNTYEALGRYLDDRPVRRWEEYHWNGRLKREVYYDEGTYTANTWDSLGSPQVINGNGRETTWHPNGRVAEEGSYVNGGKDDYWYGFYPSGAPHYQELYRANQLVRGVSKDEQGRRYVYDQLSVFPYPAIGMERFNEYLRNNYRRSADMGDAHGDIRVKFTVDARGECFDFVVVESVCVPCDREAIRLIKEGPSWRPGLERGHIHTRSPMWVTVKF
jgi:membrane associated rhomboid family serine protease